MGSGAVVRSTLRRDGPSLSRAEPWPSFAFTLPHLRLNTLDIGVGEPKMMSNFMH